MISPPSSLLKFDPPICVSKKADRTSPMGPSMRATPEKPANTCPIPPLPKAKPAQSEASNQETEQILNTIFPPRKRMEGNELWVQQVSSEACTRTDVVHLEELLDATLRQKQARERGICPIRREIYSQFLDELIRQVTIDCVKRGLLLVRVRDELRMTIAAYQEMHKSSVALGIRKALQAELGKADMIKGISDLENEIDELKKQLNEEKVKCDTIEKKEIDKRQVEEQKYTEEIKFLERVNQQLTVMFLIIPRKQISKFSIIKTCIACFNILNVSSSSSGPTGRDQGSNFTTVAIS
uniref:Axonemal dynein light intermediate polypeptide 1 n=1 Tax=Mola mola TaxID=94237 RepID=A0A3Q3X830_MOLML